MKITFLLWGVDVSGGARYIFEVVNRLIKRGHHLTLLSFRQPHEDLDKNGKPRWFTLETSIQREADIQGLIRAIPKSDVTVATYWLTAEWLNEASSNRGVPFYLIQNYEPWMDEITDPTHRKIVFERIGVHNVTGERVANTYNYPFKLIAVSTWLKNLLNYRYGRRVEAVAQGGVNLWQFSPNDRLVKERRIASFYGRHGQPRRGVNYLLEALKEIDGVEKVNLTGSDAQVAKGYRSSRVYVSASLLEGCPLTPLEAMMCGCPVVTTRIGTEDYAVNGENALVVPSKDSKALSTAIKKLLEDDELAEKLRRGGLETAKKFTWEETTDRIEKAFLER